jgi:WD40 repeat protein
MTPAASATATFAPTADWRCLNQDLVCALTQRLGVSMDQIDSFSPDWQWAVIYAGRFESGEMIGGIRFAKTDGSQQWAFYSTDMSQDIGECSAQFSTDYWSQDSRYVYFSPDPGFCSHSFNFSDFGPPVLYRLDLETGEFIEFLPFAENPTSTRPGRLGPYNFSFSPDGSYLAYVQSFNSPLTMGIKDLKTGTETAFTLDPKYREAGCLAWMQDGRDLVFYAATTTHPGDPTTASLFVVDAYDGTIRYIYRDRPNVYCALGNSYWSEHEPEDHRLVRVERYNIYYEWDAQFLLDPLTGQESAWPTSTPWPSRTHQP